MKTKWIVGLIILVILGLLVGIYFKQSKREKREQVAVTQVQRGNIYETVDATGKLQPIQEVDISPDVSGEITVLAIEEGQTVEKGDLLLKIKPDIYQSALQRSMATLNAMKSTLEASRAALALENITFASQSKLHSSGVLSEIEFQRSKNALKQAELNVQNTEFQVQNAEAVVKEAQDNLNFTTIYSPVSGTISDLNVEVGERVVGTNQMQGTAMMTIANLNGMEALIEIGESDIMKVSLGNPCKITVDAYYQASFDGVVTEIANSSKNTALDAISSFEVKVMLTEESNSKYIFKPGMSSDVTITTNTGENILKVPVQSVTIRVDSTNWQEKERSGLSLKEQEVVFVYSGDTLAKKAVSLGLQDENAFEIKDGLNEGEWVVSAPFKKISSTLQEGMPVDTVNFKKLFQR